MRQSRHNNGDYYRLKRSGAHREKGEPVKEDKKDIFNHT
jgi:hypothetical protein